MIYDIEISVKVEGCDKYARIAEPDHANPTYNLRDLFKACMDWDYQQSELGEDKEYHTVYYRCDFVIEKVNHGLDELLINGDKYVQYLPSNGWGTMQNALNTLGSLRACIYEQAENIPIECLYMSW